MEEKMFIAKEVAQYLGVKESTIRYWTHIGSIPNVKFSGAVRYKKSVIDEWIKTRERGGTKPLPEELAGDFLRAARRTSLTPRPRGRS